MKIIVTPREGDFQAQLEDHPEIATTASSQADAIVDLISSHSERFGIEIEYIPQAATT